MELEVFEVFTSFQGEGPHLGKAQIFLRLSGCNLDCRCCDTVPARAAVPAARVEAGPFARGFEEVPNPIPAEKLAGLAGRLWRTGFHSLSLTGGEPLLQAEGIAALADALADAFRPPLYLETNGTLPDALARVVDRVAVISMDVKLESVTGQSGCLPEHCAFLARTRPNQAFLKVVVSEGLDFDELDEAAMELGSLGLARALVLQPVTPVREGIESPSFETLRDAFTISSRYFQDVRVIPQTHRIVEVP